MKNNYDPTLSPKYRGKKAGSNVSLLKRILPAVIAAVVVIAVMLVVLLSPKPVDVKGKTFVFETFDAHFSASATADQKQSAIDTLLFGMDGDPGITEANFFDYFTPNYTQSVLADEAKRTCHFFEDGTVTYLGTAYTWVQDGSSLVLTSVAQYGGSRFTVKLTVVGETLVHDMTTSDQIVTKTVFRLE